MFTIITDIYKSIHAAVNKGSQCFPSLMMDVSIGALFKRFSLQSACDQHISPAQHLCATTTELKSSSLRQGGEKELHVPSFTRV